MFGHPICKLVLTTILPTDSPLPRKRQRMSSPTYDEQVDLSQDDIEAFDKIDHTLSQLHSHSQSQSRQSSQSSPSNKAKRVSRSTSLSAKEKRQRDIAEALRGQDHHARTGKENLFAVEDHEREKAPSASPVKDLASSLQPHIHLDNDSENPFKVSNTSASSALLPSISNQCLF